MAQWPSPHNGTRHWIKKRERIAPDRRTQKSFITPPDLDNRARERERQRERARERAGERERESERERRIERIENETEIETETKTDTRTDRARQTDRMRLKQLIEQGGHFTRPRAAGDKAGLIGCHRLI